MCKLNITEDALASSQQVQKTDQKYNAIQEGTNDFLSLQVNHVDESVEDSK